MMSIDRLDLKTKAKNTLRDNYWQCLVACLITNFITQVFSFTINIPTQLTGNTSGVYDTLSPLGYIPFGNGAFFPLIIGGVILSLAFSIFLIAPLTVGLKRFFIKSAQKKTNLLVIAEVFKSENYLNVVKVSFIKNIFITLWSLTGLIPYTIIVTALAILSPAAFLEYASIIPFLAIISVLPYFVKYYSYFTVDYILAQNPQVSWKEAMAQGKKMMRGMKASAFILQLSFIGWLLLGILAFGLGVIFVSPYIEATNAQLYLSLVSDKTQTEYFD